MKDFKNKDKRILNEAKLKNQSMGLQGCPLPTRSFRSRFSLSLPSRFFLFCIATKEKEMWQKNSAKDKHVAFTLADGRKPLLNSGYRRAAFTLAEVLITLAVIGIVAVLTIPSMVKSHNEKAWSTGKDLFSKKLDIAMKQMNTDGTLTGYETTTDFVNALKKNIKINQVCTDDVTKCFAKNITFGKYNPQVVTIANDNITFRTSQGQDWAETVGVRFANGVNALIAYNKNCSDDPFNNQYSPSASCIGIVYDVQANKQPNTYGKDIDINQNVSKIAGKGLCEYEMADGTCFTKILGSQNGGYTYLTLEQCEARKDELGIPICTSYKDYWAGAAATCGHKDKLPTMAQLTKLAQELYNDASIGDSHKYNLTLDTEKAAPFITQTSRSDNRFWIFSNTRNTSYVNIRAFYETEAYNSLSEASQKFNLTVCVEK